MVDARAEAFTSPRILLDPMMRMLSFLAGKNQVGEQQQQ
jgi:hypothetical protein